ncbi:unnamed protein product [Rodentolepis nana]|uniref:SCP domain-containing protein n=1 Tax=Rodentolepis nana TaxID=102285 RepID=A0A0R3TKR2_RODNA|nr:unnamed protein product [Rodentolepis nana]
MNKCVTISALLMGIVLAINLSYAQGGKVSDEGGGDGKNVSVCGGDGAESSTAMEKVLGLHNKVRRKLASGQICHQPRSYVMPLLRWNSTLAARAQAWANKCTFDLEPHGERKTAEFESYGQNIGVSQKFGKRGLMEVSTMIIANNRCRDGKMCNTYTQIVWANSTDLGCGLNRCKDSTYGEVYLVCNYGPASCDLSRFQFKLAMLEESKFEVVIGMYVLPRM